MIHSQAATHLLIILRPDIEKLAISLILNEILVGIEVTLIDTCEDALTPNTTMPFLPTRFQKRLTLALSEPLLPGDIEDIALLVTTSIILGFIVFGEINLGEDIINTFSPQTSKQLQVSHKLLEQEVPNVKHIAPSMTECDRYQFAIDTGTTEYYASELRREAFWRDERRRSLLAKAIAPTE